MPQTMVDEDGATAAMSERRYTLINDVGSRRESEAVDADNGENGRARANELAAIAQLSLTSLTMGGCNAERGVQRVKPDRLLGAFSPPRSWCPMRRVSRSEIDRSHATHLWRLGKLAIGRRRHLPGRHRKIVYR